MSHARQPLARALTEYSTLVHAILPLLDVAHNLLSLLSTRDLQDSWGELADGDEPMAQAPPQSTAEQPTSQPPVRLAILPACDA